MTAARDFLRRARATYADANAATLRWMLARPRHGGCFLDTKMNSLTLRDYSDADGLRGPAFTYGWIQGRGLESLAVHTAFFAGEDPELAAALDEAARPLYAGLDALPQADGHAYFCYDKDMRPVRPDGAGGIEAQQRPTGVYTYSDAFVAKGLVAAAARHRPASLPGHLAYFAEIIAAIEDGRFQMDERVPLSLATAATQPDDFGPRMILLGAAGMLNRLGLADHAAYAERFIGHVLDRHFDVATGLLRNVPEQDACNVGHGIEFVGFALDWLAPDADPGLVATLERILVSSFKAGFVGPGIALSVSAGTGVALSPYCPWWSLPETIRAAALCHARSGSAATLEVWRRADEAFFGSYWRGDAAIAYQTLTAAGPVDFVPATPDLDPGYHTGLSLLAAIRVADALAPDDAVHQTAR
jgi:hypothetical protein